MEEEVGMNPSKRVKLSARYNSDIDEYESEINCFSITTNYSSVTPVSSEGTLTSDSGFNELTPPRTMDEELNNQMPSSSSATQMSTESNTNKSASSDEDSMDSTISDGSGLSSSSNYSGRHSGRMSWVERQMFKGKDPRTVLTKILGDSYQIPEEYSNFMLWHAMLNMMSEIPRREKLRHINTIDDVVRLIKKCQKVIVLTGAGVSVSCGIPDFRSKDGIYARLALDFPSLPDPQAMFDIKYFRKDPRPFFKFAREIYPGQFTPSLCHRFIQLVEDHEKLLRNYTQNIDTLEQVAGINNVIQCHGSFATATCQTCKHNVSSNEIKEDIFNQVIPKCKMCPAKELIEPSSISPSSDNECAEISVPKPIFFDKEGSPIIDSSQSVMKPDIVFFGEGLADEFHDKLARDKEECDLLIVIGSSLKVRPVACIPGSLKSNVPQILINREPLPHLTFDVELLGNCDVIVSELCRRLGGKWQQLCSGDALTEIKLPPRNNEDAAGSEYTHYKDDGEIKPLPTCLNLKIKESPAARLREGQFLYDGHHRYIFTGAEVFSDADDEDESSFDDFEGDVIVSKSDDNAASSGVHNQNDSCADTEREVVNLDALRDSAS